MSWFHTLMAAISGSVSPLQGIEIPIETFLAEGQTLDTTGNTDYTSLMTTAFTSMNSAYSSDGIIRRVKWPAGIFLISTSVEAQDGCGVRGAGKSSTFFRNGKSMFVTNASYISTKYHTDNTFADFTIDGVNQVRVPANDPFYNYKGFYISRMTNPIWSNVNVVNTIGTGFGCDYIIGGQLSYCRAEGCGRGATPGEGPGAGFGIAMGKSAAEPCVFRYCDSVNNTTGGFYFEYNSGGNSPTGIAMYNCTSTGNYSGISNNGTKDAIFKDCVVSGNTIGVWQAANTVSSYTRPPINTLIENCTITNNGATNNFLSGGIVVNEATSGQAYTIKNCTINSNVTFGVINNENATLIFDGTNDVSSNGGSGIINSSVTLTLTGQTYPATLTLSNNGAIAGNTVYRDGLTILCDNTNVSIASSFSGNADKGIALRGYKNSTNLTITGNLFNQKTAGAFHTEQAITGLTNNGVYDGAISNNKLFTNRFTNPSFEAVTPIFTNLSSTTISRVADPGIYGANVQRITASANGNIKAKFPAQNGSVAVGDVVTVLCWVKGASGRTIQLFADGARLGSYAITTVVANGSWQLLQGSYVAASVGAAPAIRIPSSVSGEVTDVDAVMYTDGADFTSYFDGANNGGAWTGTANASTSTKTIAV